MSEQRAKSGEATIIRYVDVIKRYGRFTALAGVSLAQTSSGKTEEIKMAVIEFSSGANAAGLTPEIKRQLQTSLAAALARSQPPKNRTAPAPRPKRVSCRRSR
jgi:hypothetical protein